MHELEKLEGGYINEVYHLNGQVFKYFKDDGLVYKSASERALREKHALNLLGKEVTPKLHGHNGNILVQEYLQGKTLDKDIRRLGESAFEGAGSLLKKIHRPITRDITYNKIQIENRFRNAHSIAYPILYEENINVSVNIDWNNVNRFGTTFVHRDFWFGNIISCGDVMKAIDWEFSGIGTPYEDFAIVNLWVFREYQDNFPDCSQRFWQGYGCVPENAIIEQFLKIKCIEFLSATTLENYHLENNDGFYHNKIKVLKELS